MKFFRTPDFLRALRSLVLSGRRDQTRSARVITVPAPLSRPATDAVVITCRARPICRLPAPLPLRALPSAAARCKLTAT